MSEAQNNTLTCGTENTAEQIAANSGCASTDPPDDTGHNKNDNNNTNASSSQESEDEAIYNKRKIHQLCKEVSMEEIAEGGSKRAKPSPPENGEEAGTSGAAVGNKTNSASHTDGTEQFESSINTNSHEVGAEVPSVSGSSVPTNEALRSLAVSIKTEPVDNRDSSSSLTVNIKTEPVDNHVNIKTEPVDTKNTPLGTFTIVKVELPSQAEDDNVASGSSSSQKADVKPSVANGRDNQAQRPSCKFGITCYRRNPRHRVEEAHPGDSDYRRPNFPPPPDGAPDCPFGNNCYRRNPTHFQRFKHPTDTNFDWNYKIYRMRLRNRPPINVQDMYPVYDSDTDDDEEDPFADIDEDFIDVDYDPDQDDDEGIEAN